MKSDKSTSSTSVIAKQQKQTNSAVGKSKLTQTNSAKKHQPQAKKKTLTSKLVNGVSEPCKLAGSLTNGNLSDSNANHLTKDERKKSETSGSLAISSKGAKDVFAKYASTRYVVCFII